MVAGLHALSFPLPGGVCRHTEEDCHLSEVMLVMMLLMVIMVMLVIMVMVMLVMINGNDAD